MSKKKQTNKDNQGNFGGKLFGRKNKLGGVFPTNKRKSMFEEDDGFVFKRSQDKTISTPILKLNQAVNDLYDDEVFHANIGNKRMNKSNGKLSSPIRPKYDLIVYDDSPDEYIEQVSHHTIELANSPPNKRKRTNKTQKDRRSSYNNRGKRILSIGNGLVGLPHDDVSAKDYYKLLDTSLPEPHRMKQLILWCLNKVNQPIDTNEDKTAINIAKVIKDELLQDLKDGKITTSWYNKSTENSQDDSIVTNKEILLPNKLNNTTKENIEHFKQELNKLKQEKLEWQRLFAKSVEPLNELIPNDDVSIKDLEKYCKDSNRQGIMDNKLADTISELYNEIKAKFMDNLETSIDKLYNTTYQWKKVNEVVELYKRNKLTPIVSNFTKNYINKSRVENEQPQESLWPIPDKNLNVLELLKGISRLEYEAEKVQTVKE